MRGFARIHLPARQRGAFLLILLVLVSVVVIYLMVAGLNGSATDLARAQDQKNYAALAPGKPQLPGEKASATASTPEQKVPDAQPNSALEHLRRTRPEGNGNAPDHR